MKIFFTALFLSIGTFAFSHNADQENQCSFSTPYADIPDFVTTFILVNQEDNEMLTLILSDGSHWKTNPDFLEILEGWQEQDEIRWKKVKDSNQYLLKNMQSSSTVIAELDFSILPSNCYTIEAIDKNGYLILIQEDQKWSVGYWGSFTSYKWRKGDRLIINKSTYSKWEDYCLLNIDTQENVWASLIYWK